MTNTGRRLQVFRDWPQGEHREKGESTDEQDRPQHQDSKSDGIAGQRADGFRFPALTGETACQFQHRAASTNRPAIMARIADRGDTARTAVTLCGPR